MLVMEGITAILYIRNELNLTALPIIPLTVDALKTGYDKNLKAGINDHLTKQIDSELMFKTLLQWVKGKHRPMTPNNIQKPASKTIDEPSSAGQYKSILESIISDEFNLELPLHSVRGDYEFLHHLLSLFYNEHKYSAAKLSKYFKNNEIDNLKKLIHNIKGVAGHLSLNKIYDTSVNLEKALISKKDIDLQMNEIIAHLTTIINDLSVLERSDH